MNLLWVAPTGSVTAPFVPYRIGVSRIAPQFGKHRYLTKGEATRFLTRDWQIREATEFAGRTFKRLMYYTCDRPQEFLPEVLAALEAFENRLIDEQSMVSETAGLLFDNGRGDLAIEYLTRYSERAGQDALALGKALLTSLEVRTELRYGFREPTQDFVSKLDAERINCLPPTEY